MLIENRYIFIPVAEHRLAKDIVERVPPALRRHLRLEVPPPLALGERRLGPALHLFLEACSSSRYGWVEAGPCQVVVVVCGCC